MVSNSQTGSELRSHNVKFQIIVIFEIEWVNKGPKVE